MENPHNGCSSCSIAQSQRGRLARGWSLREELETRQFDGMSRHEQAPAAGRGRQQGKP
jgi:hypothetical protein